MSRLACFLTVIISGCVAGDSDDKGPETDGKADGWNLVNNPSRFEVELDYRLTSLPTKGEVDSIPWPDDYWAKRRDGVNYRWRGREHLSPAELYDVAFNGWEAPEGYMELVPFDGRNSDWSPPYYDRNGPLAHEVHIDRGNDVATNGRDDDDDGQVDETDDFEGIESWEGICHAWGRASVLEAEPVNPVTYRGLTFYSSDIKALLMTAYDAGPMIMLGGPCKNREITRDSQGRISDPACRDTNPGTFHVVVTNMLGIHRRPFVEDRVGGYEKWNQPLRGFEVTELRTGLTAAEANQILGLEGDTYSYNPEAVSFAEVRMRLDYITESEPSEGPLLAEIDEYTRNDSYHYILELDGTGEDARIVGGEWVGSSQEAHPDYLTLPLGPASGFQFIDYRNVRMLLDLSRREDAAETEGVVFEARPSKTIPDNNEQGLVSRIDVERTGRVLSLQVGFHLEHTCMADLNISLRRGNGDPVPLREGQRDEDGDGVLMARVPVDAFLGDDIAGPWELVVRDDSRSDTGTLWKWSLHAVVSTAGAEPEPEEWQTYPSSAAASIPDNDEEGASSPIQVPDHGLVRDMHVRVDIEHSYVGDLEVGLRRGGQVRWIQQRVGGSGDDIQTEFSVPEFAGSEVHGLWELFARDVDPGVSGSIRSWELTVLTE